MRDFETGQQADHVQASQVDSRLGTNELADWEYTLGDLVQNAGQECESYLLKPLEAFEYIW